MRRVASIGFISNILKHSEISDKVLGPALSMNILCAGDTSPMQKGFFTNSTGDLLPTLGFLGRLYNSCNFVIIFSLM